VAPRLIRLIIGTQVFIKLRISRVNGSFFASANGLPLKIRPHMHSSTRNPIGVPTGITSRDILESLTRIEGTLDLLPVDSP